MNFILFNGPPRSGKDTAARFAYDCIPRGILLAPVWEKFSFPVKRAFAGMMDCPIDKWGNVEPYEKTKDEVIPSLGVSYRQWQIDYSEKYMKPLYGNDIFGRLLLERSAWADDKFIFVVSDCGFQVECNVLKDHNVLLIQIIREGCTFDGDSRGPVWPQSHWKFANISNNEPVEALKPHIEAEVETWIKSL